MRTNIRRLVHSLSFRLLLRLMGLIAVILGMHAYVSARAISVQWTEMIEACANRTSDLIKDATHYSMLLNRKEELHHTIRQIARSPGVRAIRVYDKQGNIMFSSVDAEIGTKVDTQAEACVICHQEQQVLRSVDRAKRLRVFRAPDGESLVGLINPIENEAACAASGCHAPPREQSVLGVLDVMMSTQALSEAQRTTHENIVWTTLLLIFLSAVVTTLFVERVVMRPLRRLRKGSQRIAQGDLSTRVEVGPDDELGRVAVDFNRMAEDLQRAHREVTEWSQTLEQKVVAKTAELGHMQKQVVHMEKMSSLGKLSATVAHELNNPLAGILTYAKLVEREIDEPLDDATRVELHRYLKLIQKESSRCGDIVRNLLLFTRQSGAAFSPVSLNTVIDRSLLLIRHHLEMANVRLEHQPLEGSDEVIGDGNQIQQALVALLVNAIEAMRGSQGGLLRVTATGNEQEVQLVVHDTGSGIAPDVLPRIFEPFFSTKDKESGVGLGLAVVYGIIQRHQGRIDVTSDPGQGTSFIVTLPRKPASPQETPTEAR